MPDPTMTWLQTGGVLAFAGAVMWELRTLRPLLQAIRDEYIAVRVVLTKLLERDETRALIREQIRRRDPSASPVEIHDEVSGVVEQRIPLPPPSSLKTPPKGIPTGPYSHHKPKRGTSHGDR